MPIYDFKCPECKKEKKDEFVASWDTKVTCECGTLMDKQFPLGFFPDVFPSDGIFLEHVSAKGKRFFSKKEMKQYAKENDLELNAL